MTSSSNRILYPVSLNHATNDGSVYLLSSLFPIVLALFNISAPLYRAVGWRATFIVFAIWTLADVVLTLTLLRGRDTAASDDPQTPSSSKPQTKRTIPLFFVLAAFISGVSYAVILNFANIFLGTRAHLDVSQANLIVSAFIPFASLGAIATGGWTRFVPTNVLLAISYIVASGSIAAFTLLSGNAILATIALLATGFSISATYPLTYTELSRYLGSIGQQSGRSFGVLSSGQTIGASILGLASGYVSQFFSLEVSFASVAMLALVGSVSAVFWIRRMNRRAY